MPVGKNKQTNEFNKTNGHIKGNKDGAILCDQATDESKQERNKWHKRWGLKKSVLMIYFNSSVKNQWSPECCVCSECRAGCPMVSELRRSCMQQLVSTRLLCDAHEWGVDARFCVALEFVLVQPRLCVRLCCLFEQMWTADACWHATVFQLWINHTHTHHHHQS